jgi:hypothetical protein
MNTRKFFTSSFLFVMTVLIALGGIWQSAAARSGVYRLHEGDTYELGKQGLHATNIPVGVAEVYLATVKGDTLPPRFNHDVDIEYRAPAMEVRFLTENGGEVDNISALVYVYFNIGKVERALWFDGGMENIAIWFVSEETGKFEMCYTYFVNESRDNGKFDRLACLAPGSGYYVLGAGDFDVEAYYPHTLNTDTSINLSRINTAQ